MHALDLRYHAKIMRLFFRLFLWLSFTVLSFQGGAAMAVGQPGQAALETVVMTSHQHHQATAQTAGDHCSKTDPKSATSPHTKCAACASCCSGASAPPALPPILHTTSLVSSHYAIPEAEMTSFVPATLERPPRALFV
jgi:hypothetical protein